MMKTELYFPSHSHRSDCADFCAEVTAHGETFSGTSGLESIPFPDWITRIHNEREGKNIQEGRVAATTFFGYYDTMLVGIINIRHELNDFLYLAGGHIGYMVRPRARRQGHAHRMLVNALKYCKETLKLTHVLITCDPENEASKNTILSVGGRYENTVRDTPLGDVNRYWVFLE